MQKTVPTGPAFDSMFKAGAHYGLAKSRRHPSVRPFIFGVKNNVEIFDLEMTIKMLEKAKAFVANLASEGKQVLFVGGKAEARDAVKAAAMSVDMPYVAGRWIGGTLTNFAAIRSRVDMMTGLAADKEKGALAKYTKKERLLIDRKISNLEFYFTGITSMKDMPKALFVIDPKREHIAVSEAKKAGVPVIALAGSDCNLNDVDYPIVGNDAAISSVRHFAQEIAAAYAEGKKNMKKPMPTIASDATLAPKAAPRA